jgi:hypothetical protein
MPNTTHHTAMIRKINTFSTVTFTLVAVLAVIVPGCQAIADIFKAGVWVGIIIVVVIVVLIAAIGRAFKK